MSGNLPSGRDSNRDVDTDLQLFRSLFDLMPQLGWTAQPDGFIDFYNSRWYEYTGTNHDEMQGWGWEKVHDPEYLPRVVERWRYCLASGEPFEMQHPLRRADGIFRWFLTRVTPIKNSDGQIVRWVGINTDIHDQRQELKDWAADLVDAYVRERTSELQALNSRLTESERKFRAIFDHTFELIGLLSPQGILLEANKTALDFAGISADSVIGRPFWEGPWWTHSHEAQELIKNAVKEASAGEVVRFEIDHIGPGGAITVDFSLKPVFDESGAVVMLIPEGHNITERKSTERKLQDTENLFRQMSDNIVEIFWVSDSRGAVPVYVSPGYEKIFGRTAESLYKNPNEFFEACHPDDRGKLASFIRLQRTIYTPCELEYKIIRPDGEVRWLWARSFPVVDHDGKITRLCGVTSDITERKEVEKRVSEFYSMVSHELRTPLASIRGSVGLLEAGVAGELSDRAVQLLRIAHSESDRLIRLINDILDIKKIEAGKLDLKLEALDVAALIKDAMSSTALLGDPVKVNLVSKIEVPGKLRCDRDRILQVLTNLISNAIKFSPNGSEVLISVQSVRPHYLLFSVSDKGEGIAPENMPKLFGLFQQLDSSDSRPKGGTGLGLAISKAIVEQHRGSMGVDSQVGIGSTFWFDLPDDPDQ